MRSIVFLACVFVVALAVIPLTRRWRGVDRSRFLLAAAFGSLAVAVVYLVLAGLGAGADQPFPGFKLFTDPLVQSVPGVFVGLGATLLAVWAVLWTTDRNEQFHIESERRRRADDRAEQIDEARTLAIANVRSAQRARRTRLQMALPVAVRFVDEVLLPPFPPVLHEALEEVRAVATSLDLREWDGGDDLFPLMTRSELDSREKFAQRDRLVEAMRRIRYTLEADGHPNSLAAVALSSLIDQVKGGTQVSLPGRLTKACLVAAGAQTDPDWLRGLAVDVDDTKGAAWSARLLETDQYIEFLRDLVLAPLVLRWVRDLSDLSTDAPFTEAQDLAEVLSLPFTTTAEFESRIGDLFWHRVGEARSRAGQESTASSRTEQVADDVRKAREALSEISQLIEM